MWDTKIRSVLVQKARLWSAHAGASWPSAAVEACTGAGAHPQQASQQPSDKDPLCISISVYYLYVEVRLKSCLSDRQVIPEA